MSARDEAIAPATAATLAVGGLVSLAVAMGIGRFAFTPILPMMLRDGTVDIASASWLASANYIGYLIGAVLCTLQPWLAARISWLPAAFDAPRAVRAGLAATALLTLGMALPWSAAWPALRFAAGVASAVTLIHTTGWCFAQLAARGRSAIGGLVFAGPGAGIVVSGAVAGALVGAHRSAAVGWSVFAVLAAIATAAVWRVFDHRNDVVPAAGIGAANAGDAEAHAATRAEVAMLALGYGLAGFGYIVTATFLPVIARAALPGSTWIAWFWPIFGIGSIAGAVLATRIGDDTDRRLLLAAAHAIQAAGVTLGLLWPTVPGFVAGSLLVGLPFTTITYFALQEVRRLRPQQAASAIGLLTALYGAGQIAGPPMVSALVASSAEAAFAFGRVAPRRSDRAARRDRALSLAVAPVADAGAPIGRASLAGGLPAERAVFALREIECRLTALEHLRAQALRRAVAAGVAAAEKHAGLPAAVAPRLGDRGGAVLAVGAAFVTHGSRSPTTPTGIRTKRSRTPPAASLR